MKLYQIFILGLLFTLISSTFNYDDKIESLKDCGELDETEKKNGKTHCCFVQAGETKFCFPYSQDEYDAFKKSEGSTQVGGQTYKYECNLPYLKLGFLSLIFGFLWI